MPRGIENIRGASIVSLAIGGGTVARGTENVRGASVVSRAMHGGGSVPRGTENVRGAGSCGARGTANLRLLGCAWAVKIESVEAGRVPSSMGPVSAAPLVGCVTL
jgi:hypothetical protein